MSTQPIARSIRATTIRLPERLYQEAKHFVEAAKANESSSLSVNDFFVTAIQAYVKLQERREVDAAFALMADDPAYQAEAIALSEEFAASDWEALRLSEAR